MKTFKNSKGVKIFELDYNGNLYISGDLTLSPESTITAGNIKALVDADVAVIREAIDMATPYLGRAGVVYYLGETTEDYTYGTWWEKYAIGYNCTIDVSYTQVPSFTVYEGNALFYVTDNDVYSYNKIILDANPTTNKIVVTAINISGNAHWEIKYYNENTLLYTDITEDSYFTSIGYNFPFTPINAEDYSEGSTDIIINVQSEYALKEINAIDWQSFMPKTGGEFQGIIYTKDVAPLQADTYSIGTETGRYKNGYFTNLYTGYLKTNTLSIENLDLEKFTLSSTKTDLTPGDGIVITDGADNNSVKASSILKFSGDKTRYLRQDGTFAQPATVVKTVEVLNDTEQISGAIIFYSGNEYSSLTTEKPYLGEYSNERYQFRIKGATFSLNNNACIIKKDLFNTDNKLIKAINELGLGDVVEDFIEKDGKITLLFNITNNTWVIKGLENKGAVSSTQLGINNVAILNSLTKANSAFKVSEASSNIEVTISKFIWEPVNPITFDGISTNQYLSKAGTWEYFKQNQPEEGEENFTEIPFITVSCDLVNGLFDTPTILDNFTAPGFYLLKNTYGQYIGNISISQVNEFTSQTITAVGVHKFFDDNEQGFIIDRVGAEINGVMQWDKWNLIVNNTTQIVHNLQDWKLPSRAEMEYLLNNRNPDDLETYGKSNGPVILNGVKGWLFKKDISSNEIYLDPSGYPTVLNSDRISSNDYLFLPVCDDDGNGRYWLADVSFSGGAGGRPSPAATTFQFTVSESLGEYSFVDQSLTESGHDEKYYAILVKEYIHSDIEDMLEKSGNTVEIPVVLENFTGTLSFTSSILQYNILNSTYRLSPYKLKYNAKIINAIKDNSIWDSYIKFPYSEGTFDPGALTGFSGHALYEIVSVGIGGIITL